MLHAPGAIEAKLAETLGLYDIRWSGPLARVDIEATATNVEVASARGSMLRCARMSVDARPPGLFATTRSGATVEWTPGNPWTVAVPDALVASGALEELEDVVALVLTESWRAAGWVPIHAAAVERDGTCAIVCAATGGGKTTLTASLVRSGWRTLGDDKLLVRMRDGEAEVAALLHTFNLHPRTREWFPEVGALEDLPRYSVWTEKRKLRALGIWPDAGSMRAKPTRVVALERSDAHGEVHTRPLESGEILSSLLRQTVIPSDPYRASRIVGTIATIASSLGGVGLEIGSGAYADETMRAAIARAVAGP